MKTVTLGAVCSVTMGQAPVGTSYNEQGAGLPLLAGAGDLGDLTPSPKRFTTAPGKVAELGDLILCVRATIGDRNWADRRYCLGRGVAGLRPVATVLDARYLWHALGALAPALAREGRGSTFQQVTRQAVERLRFPLPPLPEQRRIAAILDQADELRRKRREGVELVPRLLDSAFHARFGGPEKVRQRWPLKPLADLAEITTGNTPPRAEANLYGGSLEWIKSDNINQPGFYLTRAEEMLSEEGAAFARTVGTGATLMTCIAGSPGCIGNVSLTDRTVAFNQQINALLPRTGVDGRFLYALLRSEKPAIQAAATSGMKGLLSKGRLSQVRVPAPPLEEQRAFGEYFEELARTREILARALGGAETLSGALSSALLSS